MRKITCFVISACVISLMGCASIVSDSQYPVSIISSPEGANIAIEDYSGQRIYSGTTPTTVTLNSSDGFFRPAQYTLICKKEGCNTRRIPIRSSMDGWYIGNLAFGGIIGFLIVDPATGAMWKLDEKVNINLPIKKSASNKEKLHILTLNQIPKEVRSRLKLID